MVRKASGPSLKIERPPLKKCDVCKGDQLVQGAFYEMPCDACDVTGALHKETGEKIPVDIALLLLGESNRRLRRENKLLRNQLKKHQPDFDPYGELKDKDGGKYRGD